MACLWFGFGLQCCKTSWLEVGSLGAWLHNPKQTRSEMENPSGGLQQHLPGQGMPAAGVRAAAAAGPAELGHIWDLAEGSKCSSKCLQAVGTSCRMCCSLNIRDNNWENELIFIHSGLS